jgi:hypothetical protein
VHLDRVGARVEVLTRFPLASTSEITNASFLPTLPVSGGLSALAVADGMTIAAAEATSTSRRTDIEDPWIR